MNHILWRKNIQGKVLLITAFFFLAILYIVSFDSNQVSNDYLSYNDYRDIWSLSPDFLEATKKFEAFFYSDKTLLPPRLVEVVALVNARFWTVQSEWAKHAFIARCQGIDESIIKAIAFGLQPDFKRIDEEAVYQYSIEMLSRGQVNEKTYQATESILTKKGVVELAALVGYHTMIAMTLKTFRKESSIEAKYFLPKIKNSSEYCPKINIDPLNGREESVGSVFSKNAFPASFGLMFPELELGMYIRSDISQPNRLVQLAILIAARHWNSSRPWYAHAQDAIDSGISHLPGP